MKKDILNKFEGERILRTMGVSWFISYMWYNVIDNNHDNWKYVPTTQTRINAYERGKKHHKLWLSQITYMSVNNLNQNKIGIPGRLIKEMAEILYSKI